MRFLFLFIFISTALLLNGQGDYQQRADSLKILLRKAKHDSTRVRLLNEISGKFYNINVDSSLSYAEKAYKLAIKSGDRKGQGEACSNMGDALFYKGNVEESIEENKKAIAIFEEINYQEGVIDAYISIGQGWKELGKYPESVESYMKALKAADKLNDPDRKGRVMLSLGVLFLDQNKYNEALKYSKDALSCLLESDNKAQIANAYARIGNVFGRKENPAYNNDSTLFYYGLSLSLFTEINHQRGIGVIYNNMASIYSDKRDYKTAIDCYEKALGIRNNLGDQNGAAIILNNMGTTYRSMKQMSKALEYLRKSLAIAIEIQKPDIISDNYFNLAECYAEMGDYKKAFEYKNLFIEVKDSMMNESNSRIITEMQTQYETEKKEKEIELLQQNKKVISLQIREQKDKVKFQKYVIYGVIGVLSIVLIFSFFILRLFIQKKKANVLLRQQNSEILQQREEISTQRDEIEAQRDEIMSQRDLVIDQKKQIEHILGNVTSSIRYAKQIQNSMLPAPEFLKETLSEHFIFYLPRDIVSGDFYWAARTGSKTFFCVADCTGHGVPGAFMSMLGISSLNEIIAQSPELSPEIILEKLRERVIWSLKQKTSAFDITASDPEVLSVKDGMDIALCVLDRSSRILSFAGANNPLYIVRSRQLAVGNAGEDCLLSTANCQLTEIKPDKMPIGIHYRMSPYAATEISVEKGDMIYLFSDGYADQTGGESGQKLKYKPFKEFLVSVSGKPLDVQKIKIEKHFTEWKGSHEQIDDVLVMGIKI